jgi:hypothetical protein
LFFKLVSQYDEAGKKKTVEVSNYTIQWHLLRTITTHTDSDYTEFNKSNIKVP